MTFSVSLTYVTMRELVIFALALVSVWCNVVNAQYSFSRANALEESLVDGYSRAYRPEAQTQVYVRMGLMHLTELNIVAQELVVGGFLVAKWTDSRLAWNSTEWGGINVAFMFHGKIWTPPLLLSNAGNGIKMLNDDSSLASVVAKVSSDGDITWLYPVNFNAQCSVNIMFYPFDYQSCSMKISTWMYTSTQVSLKPADSSINMDIYEENGEWDVFSTSCSQSSTLLYGVYEMSAISCEMRLIRKYAYYVMNLILPVIILATMGPFVFILPVESGEKNGFALTIMLSLSVVMTMVSEFIPTTATHVCILSVYLLTTFILCSLETLVAVLTCRIHDFHNKGYTPSARNQGFLRFLAKLTFYSRAELDVDARGGRPSSSSGIRRVKVMPLDDSSWTKNEKPKHAVDEEEDNDTRDDIADYTYEEYAVLLDRFHFGMFMLLNAVVILVFMLYISNGDGF